MAEQEELFRWSPFLVVGDVLRNVTHAARPEGWIKVECGKREAYGCGEKGQRIVQGLDLYVQAVPEDPEFRADMRIGATPDVLNLVGEEIDEKMAEICGREIQLCAIIDSVDGGVMVLHVSLVARHKGADFRSYCLVYDSTAKALFLLPQKPNGSLLLWPSSPLKVGEDKFSVVLMVEKLSRDSTSPYPVLCLWSPPALLPAKRKHTLNEEESAWIDKGRILRLEAPDAIGFMPTHVFSYNGNAVWGDLGRGILYCDCGDLNLGPAPVDFKFNMLPSECWAPPFEFDKPPLPVFRNMGCVGDYIWFVIIKPPSEGQDPGETVVKVWTLYGLSEEEEWEPRYKFKMQTIWDLDAFRAHRLPKTVPMFPIIRQKDDGILYMLLPEPSTDDVFQHAHLLGIDLSSSLEASPLKTRRLIIPSWHRPIVLDPDFFGPRHMF